MPKIDSNNLLKGIRLPQFQSIPFLYLDDFVQLDYLTCICMHTNPTTMSSSPVLPCIVFSLFLLLINPISARIPANPFSARALLLPVTKDPSNAQYITTIFQRTPLHPVRVAVDIGGKALWVACDKEEYRSSTYNPARCRSPLCNLAKSTSCGNCWEKPRAGCNNNTCNNVVYNPFEKSGQIGTWELTFWSFSPLTAPIPGRLFGPETFHFLVALCFLERIRLKACKG